MALFCVQIDYFAMNLALPRMAFDLKSTTTDLQWVISVYMLALGAFMVPAGRIGDIFGRRRALLAGVVGLRHSGIGQCGRPADRWAAHRDGRLAMDILVERSAHARRDGHWSANHHRIVRRNGAASHRRGRVGAHYRRNWLVHLDI
jgi:MFS transporter